MKYFYDTEFIEDGKTIQLISIGVVAEDGRELYLIHGHAPWDRIVNNEWLRDNVMSSLPMKAHQTQGDTWGWKWDRGNLDFWQTRERALIADEVEEFLLAGDSNPELWAYYGAYDHVVLAQLFGPMIKLPDGIPMFTHDIMQEAHRLGVKDQLPTQENGHHNALADARHVQTMHNWLSEQR